MSNRQISRHHKQPTVDERQRGSLLVELASASVFLLIFVLLSVYLCTLILGAYFNDRACRDAARAAAQGENLAQATELARSVLTGHASSGGFIGQPVLQTPIVYQDYGGAPPARISPFVQVTTKTTVSIPFAPLSLFNSTAFDSRNLAFSQTYTFPIVRVK